MLKIPPLTPETYEYVIAHGVRQDELLTRVERETEELGSVARMQLAPDEGALLTLLVRALGVRRALEIGTFTGYSAICIARGLPEDGRLVCCEISEDYAATARENLRAAGLEERVEIRVGPALDTLRSLPRDYIAPGGAPADGGAPFDFAFIDADKESYNAYYEEALSLVRRGGLIAVDNVLLRGRVLHPEEDERARAIDALNRRIATDERVDCAMLAIADGLTLVRKR